MEISDRTVIAAGGNDVHLLGALAEVAADETVATLGDDDAVVTQEVIDEAPEN